MKEVIGASKDDGFNIFTSVCDGSSSNQAAINILLCGTGRLKGEDHVYGVSLTF